MNNQQRKVELSADVDKAVRKSLKLADRINRLSPADKAKLFSDPRLQNPPPKEELAARNLKADLQTKDYKGAYQQCSNCNTRFIAKDGASSCSDRCRQALSRKGRA